MTEAYHLTPRGRGSPPVRVFAGPERVGGGSSLSRGVTHRGELLVNLHVRRVRESGRGCVRRLHRGDSVRAHVQHERGDDARLVRAVGVLHVAAQLAQKRVRAVVRQKRVELVEEAVARERVRKRREDAWRLRNLGEEIHLQAKKKNA
eukprot:2981930-Pleurochrysis_carterae.AAC.1